MKSKEKVRAILTINGAPDMTPEGRRVIADWLRHQAKELRKQGDNYKSRFTARYIAVPLLLILALACIGATAQDVTIDGVTLTPSEQAAYEAAKEDGAKTLARLRADSEAALRFLQTAREAATTPGQRTAIDNAIQTVQTARRQLWEQRAVVQVDPAQVKRTFLEAEVARHTSTVARLQALVDEAPPETDAATLQTMRDNVALEQARLDAAQAALTALNAEHPAK